MGQPTYDPRAGGYHAVVARVENGIRAGGRHKAIRRFDQGLKIDAPERGMIVARAMFRAAAAFERETNYWKRRPPIA